MISNATDIKVQSREVLQRLYEVFDELGMAHRYSEELGEIDIKVGDGWLNFYLDPAVIDEEQQEKRWVEDAYAVAETYWRQ